MKKNWMIGVLLIIAAGLIMYLAGSGRGESGITPDEPVAGDAGSQFTLEGTTWDFGDQGRLEFADGRYSASVGCNTMAGAYVLDNGSISFNDGQMTLMACPPEIADAETKFLAQISLIDSYRVEDTTVILYGDGAEVILRQPVNLGLTGTQWSVQSMKEGEAIVSAAIDEGTFILFESDGRFSGKSACNSIMGGYEVVDNAITFSDIASTKMACPEELMAREQLLVETLQNAVSFSIDRDVLSIESTDGEYLVTLRASSEE